MPGTFTYTPAIGTILPSGQSQILSVTFTPTDTTDYASVTATTTINVVSRPPMIISEQPIFQRKLKHGKPTGKPVLIGYMIDFSSKLSASSAELASNYVVDMINTKKVKKHTVTSLKALTNFTVSYYDTSDSVSLRFTNPPTFKTGGEITILGGPTNGITDLSGIIRVRQPDAQDLPRREEHRPGMTKGTRLFLENTRVPFFEDVTRRAEHRLGMKKGDALFLKRLASPFSGGGGFHGLAGCV